MLRCLGFAASDKFSYTDEPGVFYWHGFWTVLFEQIVDKVFYDAYKVGECSVCAWCRPF